MYHFITCQICQVQTIAVIEEIQSVQGERLQLLDRITYEETTVNTVGCVHYVRLLFVLAIVCVTEDYDVMLVAWNLLDKKKPKD